MLNLGQYSVEIELDDYPAACIRDLLQMTVALVPIRPISRLCHHQNAVFYVQKGSMDHQRCMRMDTRERDKEFG